MAEHYDLGIKGEEIATGYLRKKGYAIRDCNWRSGREEVDIIAEKDDTLVIVEVKTRSGNFFGEPEEFVSRSKQRSIIKVANAYINRYDIDMETRFDIVSIIVQGKSYKVNHLEDAFYPLV